MSLRKYLTEERLHGQDKRSLFKVIANAEKGKLTGKADIILKSFKKNYTDEERVVEIRYQKDGVEFTYNADHFELTNTLVDICDNNGYKFKTDTERNINTTTFTIMLPK